jgi:tetrahydromethanopterin S-methyltransferase subunit G
MTISMTRDLTDATPRTQREVNALVLGKLHSIELKVDTTNGRVRALEKFGWAIGGGLVVLSLIVVPIFVALVTP